MASYFVSAYTASPESLEEQFFSGLRRLDHIAGLELPFYGKLHRTDDRAFLSRLDKSWVHVMTCLPGTMNHMAENSAFGLASCDEAGRRSAIDFIAKAKNAVNQLNEFYGKTSVLGVEVHSGPKKGPSGAESSAQCFAESLAEIRSWNWQGATLLVEHCDAYKEGDVPVKGFLTLEEEIRSIEITNDCGTPAAISINWARSAIEGKGTELPLIHIEKAKHAGLMAALFFSGCTQADPLWGHWADSHAPFSVPHGFRGASNSILNIEQMRRCLNAAGEPLPMVGLKIQPFPTSLDVAERLHFVEDGIKILELARNGMNSVA